MPKPVKVGLVSALLSALLASMFVATASAALPKPKPWQWKPAKVALRITAGRPVLSASTLTPAEIQSAVCTGQGRGIAGRFTRFTCETQWRGEATITSTLTIRIRPIGSGKLCVVTTVNNSGQVVAVPHKLNTGGTVIKPELACPTS